MSFIFHSHSLAIISISSLIISGCSQNFKSTNETLKAAFEGYTPISSDYIQSVPYASSLVSINDGNPIFVILAFADKNPHSNQYKLTWMASDKGTITTESGRITHTTGLDDTNLDGLTHKNSSNLKTPGIETSWQAIYDWSPGYRYQFLADINSTSKGIEIVKTDQWTAHTQKISEAITIESLKSQFTNHFWVVPQHNGHKATVMKSIQYLGPNMTKVEMLITKPFLEPILPPTPSQNKEVE